MKQNPTLFPINRRQWLKQAGCGLGITALTSLLHDHHFLVPRVSASDTETSRSEHPLAVQSQQFQARAKHIIWIFINGGPSQVDTWDHKPALSRWDGKSIQEFDSGFKNTTGFFKNSVGKLMQSPFSFFPRGQSGKMVSSIFPQLGSHVDKMAFIHSGFTESNNHSPALFMMICGLPRMGFPCLGSWVTYGLGSENQNLPAFVVMSDPKGRGLPKGYAGNWSAGFLPSVYQGTHLQPTGIPIPHLIPSGKASDATQKNYLDLIRKLNHGLHENNPEESELTARMESFELAYRMQSAAPASLDIDSEPAHIHRLYGLDNSQCNHFGRQCLMARRLVERGVRFVQIYSGGSDNQHSWDGHSDIAGNHQQFAGETDQPVAGLIHDLDQRGLLDQTLIVWCGEFGRLPVAQTGEKLGRDHNPHCFSAWLAGGSIKGGVTYGSSDEIGFRASENPVHINDLHATILHLLGIDHKRLTYRYNGREFRLTDVAGKVLHPILA